MAQIIVDLEKLQHNINYISKYMVSKYMVSRQIELIGVLKGFSAFPELVGHFLEGGISNIGVSRIVTARWIFEHFQLRPVCMALPSIHSIA